MSAEIDHEDYVVKAMAPNRSQGVAEVAINSMFVVGRNDRRKGVPRGSRVMNSIQDREWRRGWDFQDTHGSGNAQLLENATPLETGRRLFREGIEMRDLRKHIPRGVPDRAATLDQIKNGWLLEKIKGGAR